MVNYDSSLVPCLTMPLVLYHGKLANQTEYVTMISTLISEYGSIGLCDFHDNPAMNKQESSESVDSHSRSSSNVTIIGGTLGAMTSLLALVATLYRIFRRSNRIDDDISSLVPDEIMSEAPNSEAPAGTH